MTMAGSFTRQTGRILVALALAGAVGWWLLQPRPSDRERLEELVARAEHGFENRSVGEIMSCVAQDYRDDSGLTRAEVLYLARRLALEARKVEVTINSADIQVAGEKAVGRFDAEVVVSEGGEAIPWPMRLEVQFRKERRGWSGLWRKEWVVKSVSGHGLDKSLVDSL